MEKRFRREFGINGQTKKTIVIVMVAVFIFTAFVYGFLYGKVEKIVLEDSQRHLADMSRMNVENVSRELYNRSSLVESVAFNLSVGYINDVDKIVDRMIVYREKYDFYDMGVLTVDGELHTTAGRVADVSSMRAYQRVLEGDYSLSDTFATMEDPNMLINLMSAPVYREGKLKFIITATYKASQLAEWINSATMESGARNLLVDQSGVVKIFPTAKKDEHYNRIARLIDSSRQIVPQDNMNVPFEFEGEKYLAHYEELGVNDWYLITFAPEETALAGAREILHNVTFGMVFLWVLIYAAVIVILWLCVRFQDRMHRTVFLDPLLGECNVEFLRMYYPKMPREKKRHTALFVMDVDNFKEFNFINGSECGDELLRYLNRTFKEVLPDDDLFRCNADLFAGLLDCYSLSEAEDKINQVIGKGVRDIEAGVINPFDLSIGVRMLDGGGDFQKVFSEAIIAKNTVKGNHVQKYAVYDDRMRQERMTQLAMESDFRRAVREKEFRVFYQPKYDMRTGEIVGAEALVRWVKKDGKIIPPNEFIPCFEASRQIVILDQVVTKQVCTQLRELKNRGLPVLPVSVNLSRVHLKVPHVLDELMYTVKTLGVDPASLAFEITESAFFEDKEMLEKLVAKLHDMGCKVNMDDYGTGISGPSSLANVRFDVIKLDKSFVDGIGDEKMETIIRSTITLAANLGMDVIAEGVEEREQVEKLVKWGCNFAQGFYYSKPIREEEYVRLLEEKMGAR